MAKPAATAAADPPLDPPGTRDVSCGFLVGPKAEFSVLEPIANSSRFVLPMITAPASRSLVTIVASYGGFHPSRIFDEHVVGIPRVHMLSLSATGTPASGPGSLPAATSASTSAARIRASSASTVLNAWISVSRRSISARWRSTTSTAVSEPSRTWSAIATAVIGSVPSGPLIPRVPRSVGRGIWRPRPSAPRREPRRDRGSAVRRRRA